MRISNNLLWTTYESNLQQIQNRKLSIEEKVTTGKDVNSLSDSPKKVVNIKQLTNKINRNESYQNTIDDAIGEMTVVSEDLESLYNDMEEIRQIAIESTLTGNSSNLKTLGTYVKGLLDDVVSKANSDFNGRFVFAGTITTADGITVTPPATDTQPFELVQGTVTTDNPSGLEVVFKGNNKDRAINKDDTSTEVVNTTAADIFGGTGNEIFSTIISLYNKLSYNDDGTERTSADGFSREDMEEVDGMQTKIQEQVEAINNAAAVIGSKMNRLTTVKDQISTENTRLKEYRSMDEDTDYAQAAIDLARESNALQYTLQIGTDISGLTLFDYLS